MHNMTATDLSDLHNIHRRMEGVETISIHTAIQKDINIAHPINQAALVLQYKSISLPNQPDCIYENANSVIIQ